MKPASICSLLMLISSIFSGLKAQDNVNYQAILYRNGQIEANASIIVETYVLDENTSRLYNQYDTVFTDELGLINIKLGKNTEQFSKLDWSNPNLKIGGKAYLGNQVIIDLGTQFIPTVPKSLFSNFSARLDNLNFEFDPTTNKLNAFSLIKDKRFSYSSASLPFIWQDLPQGPNPNAFAFTNRSVVIGRPSSGTFPTNLGSFTIFNSNSGLDFYNTSDRLYARFGHHPGGFGSFNLYNTTTNQIAVTSSVTSAGGPTLNLYGPNGQFNAFLSNVSGNANRGYLGIVNENGVPGAGMIYRADGTAEVFGGIKTFKMEHPTQPGKEIWYAAVEGPEAAAFIRGTAKLQNGEVRISFPEHYQLTVNAGTMTVSLTPLSAESKGLAVIQKGEKGITIKELAGGKGNYEFDWEVKAVRKGLENFRVIRDASETSVPQLIKFDH